MKEILKIKSGKLVENEFCISGVLGFNREHFLTLNGMTKLNHNFEKKKRKVSFDLFFLAFLKQLKNLTSYCCKYIVVIKWQTWIVSC